MTDDNRLAEKTARLAEAGLSPEQIQLALDTSASLRALLNSITPEDAEASMRDLFAEFARDGDRS